MILYIPMILVNEGCFTVYSSTEKMRKLNEEETVRLECWKVPVFKSLKWCGCKTRDAQVNVRPAAEGAQGRAYCPHSSFVYRKNWRFLKTQDSSSFEDLKFNFKTPHNISQLRGRFVFSCVFLVSPQGEEAEECTWLDSECVGLVGTSFFFKKGHLMVDGLMDAVSRSNTKLEFEREVQIGSKNGKNMLKLASSGFMAHLFLVLRRDLGRMLWICLLLFGIDIWSRLDSGRLRDVWVVGRLANNYPFLVILQSKESTSRSPKNKFSPLRNHPRIPYRNEDMRPSKGLLFRPQQQESFYQA